MSEYDGIEPRTVATVALAVRRSNNRLDHIRDGCIPMVTYRFRIRIRIRIQEGKNEPQK
jgi:hypothetical protein